MFIYVYTILYYKYILQVTLVILAHLGTKAVYHLDQTIWLESEVLLSIFIYFVWVITLFASLNIVFNSNLNQEN